MCLVRVRDFPTVFAAVVDVLELNGYCRKYDGAVGTVSRVGRWFGGGV